MMHRDLLPKIAASKRPPVWNGALAIGITVGLWHSLAVSQELSIPGQQSLADVEEIELVYAGIQSIPEIIVRGPQSANSFVLSSYRPLNGRWELIAPSMVGQPTGACQVNQGGTVPPLHIQVDHLEAGICGVMWSLYQASKSLDALSFRTLRMRGTTSSSMRIELRDALASQQRARTVAEHITGRFSLDIPLALLAERIDLRQLTQLRLVTQEAADILLEEVALLGPESETPPTPSIGFWYWDYRSAIGHPEWMIAACQKQHCRRIILQLPDMRDSEHIWAAYAQLFTVTKSSAIELVALDGAPDMIDHATPLIEKLDRLLALVGNREVPGVQLDIEPYLLDGFPEDETIFQRYLDAIDRVKTALQGRTKLSVVIPFWFASTIHRHRPLAFSVMDRVNEVAVMSYRTEVDELLTISDDILRYGALRGVPVWLALETTSLLPERHVILKREHTASLSDGTLDAVRRTLTIGAPPQQEQPEKDGIWFRIHHHMTIRPERISFSGRTEHEVQRTITDVFAQIHHSNFSGLVIHDLPGYLALQP